MDELKNELDLELRIPIAFTAFSEITEMPFLIILSDLQTHGADDKLFYTTHDVTLELYTEAANDCLISQLTNFLISKNQPFSKETNYIATERMFQTIYNLEEFNNKIKEQTL